VRALDADNMEAGNISKIADATAKPRQEDISNESLSNVQGGMIPKKLKEHPMNVHVKSG